MIPLMSLWLIFGGVTGVILYDLGSEDKRHRSITYFQSVKFILIQFVLWILLLYFYPFMAILIGVLSLALYLFLRRKSRVRILMQADMEIFGSMYLSVFPIAAVTFLLYFGASIIRSRMGNRKPYPALWYAFLCYCVAYGIFILLYFLVGG